MIVGSLCLFMINKITTKEKYMKLNIFGVENEIPDSEYEARNVLNRMYLELPLIEEGLMKMTRDYFGAQDIIISSLQYDFANKKVIISLEKEGTSVTMTLSELPNESESVE